MYGISENIIKGYKRSYSDRHFYIFHIRHPVAHVFLMPIIHAVPDHRITGQRVDNGGPVHFCLRATFKASPWEPVFGTSILARALSPFFDFVCLIDRCSMFFLWLVIVFLSQKSCFRYQPLRDCKNDQSYLDVVHGQTLKKYISSWIMIQKFDFCRIKDVQWYVFLTVFVKVIL